MIFRRKFFLLFILILGLFLRLIYLREWFHFEMDEEVIAWKLRPFLQEGRPFLIGGGTPFGFHLGPAFYYLSAIPLFFSGLDPIGWGVAAAIFGTVTIWLMWLVGKTLYNQRIGLVAALLWAASFTAVMSDRHWWPLVLDPMLSLIVILCLYRICVIPAKAGIYINRFRVPPSLTVRLQELFVHGSRSAIRRAGEHGMTWIALGLALAFGWQTDLTVLPLFLASAVVAFRNWKSQKRGVATAVLILLASVLPLVLFELRHPGANLGQLGFSFKRSHLLWPDLLKAATFPLAALGRLLFPITHLDGDLLKFYTWCREIADGRVAGQPWWATGVTIFLLLTPFFTLKTFNDRRSIITEFVARVYQTIPIILKSIDDRRRKLKYFADGGFGKKSEADKILRLVISSSILGILLFKLLGGNLYDFYLTVLYPVVILLAARSIDFIWRKWGILAGGLIMTVIVGFNLTAIVRVYHPQGLAVKQEAAVWAAEKMRGKGFELDSLSGCSRYNGVRYLFFLENMEPAKSFVDQDLSWLYPSYDEQSKPEYLVTFATPDDLTEQDRERYRFLSEQAEAKRSFGDLEVLITKK